jgi:insulysin
MNIIKPPSDKNIYKNLKLDNGLEAVIIQNNNNTDKLCSVALAVNTGYSQDPDSVPGLAHFLEHMLFMGTKKYPDVNTFFSFLSKHGGSSNAMTANDHTVYFFDIESDHLEQALEIFANFFIEPLFAENTITKEINAVDSEDSKNKSLDVVRLDMILKLLAPGHTFSKFGGGNSRTLNVHGVRDKLIEFYNKYYTPDNFKLVVFANKDMEIVVKGLFGAIKKAHKKESIHKLEGLPFGSNKLIKFKSIIDLQSLHIFWQMPNMKKYYQLKPVEYILMLLGHEGQGTAIDYLKKLSLITDVTFDVYMEQDSFEIIRCVAILTDKGFNNYDQVVSCIYDYIELVGEGVRRDYFEELKKINELNFKYLEEFEPGKITLDVATNMLKFPIYDVLFCHYRYDKFDKERILEVLGYFKRANSVMALSSQEYNFKTNEHWYGTQYEIVDMGQGDHKKIKLVLPHKNNYIPRDVELLEGGGNIYPVKLNDFIWFKQDNQFHTPYVVVQVVLHTEKLLRSAVDNVAIRMFKKLVETKLAPELYYAALANCVVNFEVYDYFMVLFVGGYGENIDYLLEQVLQFKIDSNMFESCLEDLRMELRSIFYDQPIKQVGDYLKLKADSCLFSPEELLDATDHVTLDNVLGVRKKFELQGLVQGNIANADSIVKLLGKIRGKTKAFTPRDYSLMPGEELYLRSAFNPDFDDCGVGVFYEIGVIDRKNPVDLLYLYLVHIKTAEKFFYTLRTEEQLAYLVKAEIVSLGDYKNTGLIYLIQTSKKSPPFIRKRIKEFIKNCEKDFVNITDNNFEIYKEAVKSKFIKPDKNILDEAKTNLVEIIKKDYMFDFREKLAAKLDALNKEDLLKFFRTYFINSTKKVRIVEIYNEK